MPEFRAVVLGQLGESRLDAAIDADLAGTTARARPLDADATGALRDIHRRVGTAILFESSGGQMDKVAHLPELRFALGEPDVDTTTIDNASSAQNTTAPIAPRFRPMFGMRRKRPRTKYVLATASSRLRTICPEHGNRATAGYR